MIMHESKKILEKLEDHLLSERVVKSLKITGSYFLPMGEG
jgi:hypothetical protein